MQSIVPVLVASERRLHLIIRIERPAFLIGEREMMRRCFAGDLYTPLLRPAYHLDGFLRRNMRDMHPAAGVAGKQDVALYHYLFRSRRNRFHAERGGDRPLVHHALARKVSCFAVVYHGHIEHRGVFHRPSHQEVVHHVPAVVRYRNAACAVKFAYLGEGFPFRSLGYRADRINVNRTLGRGFLDYELRHGFVIVHGIRVRHTGNRSESPRRRRLCACLNSLRLLAPRFAQVDVHIYKTGRHDLARSLDDVRAGLRYIATDLRHFSVLDQDIERF
jgi:hypothetical protein